MPTLREKIIVPNFAGINSVGVSLKKCQVTFAPPCITTLEHHPHSPCLLYTSVLREEAANELGSSTDPIPEQYRRPTAEAIDIKNKFMTYFKQ